MRGSNEGLAVPVKRRQSLAEACKPKAHISVFLQDTAASYGLGAVGGLMYLRLLNRSVDGMGASFLGAAGGQARLLIPVILALAYNRHVQTCNSVLSTSQ